MFTSKHPLKVSLTCRIWARTTKAAAPVRWPVKIHWTSDNPLEHTADKWNCVGKCHWTSTMISEVLISGVQYVAPRHPQARRRDHLRHERWPGQVDRAAGQTAIVAIGLYLIVIVIILVIATAGRQRTAKIGTIVYMHAVRRQRHALGCHTPGCTEATLYLVMSCALGIRHVHADMYLWAPIHHSCFPPSLRSRVPERILCPRLCNAASAQSTQNCSAFQRH